MGKRIGVDLGTANTVICVKGRGIVLRAPSVVAISEETGEVVAVGRKARQMLGKTPPSIRVERPLRNGVITDEEIAAKMLHEFFKEIGAFTLFSRPDVSVCTPCKITGVERNAVMRAIYSAGARTVDLIEEPLASAFGAGIQIEKSRGAMIVDIGGGTTEVAVVCSEGISRATTIRIAGDAMDRAIINYMQRGRGVSIGELDAEDLKIRVGSVHGAELARTPADAYGQSVRSNTAAVARVNSSELASYLQYPAKQIVRAILDTLESTPPELASDIKRNGIVLTGGSSQLRGMARLIGETLGIPVHCTRHPLDTVCLGLSRIIESEPDSNFSRFFGKKGDAGDASRLPFGIRSGKGGTGE